MYFHHSDEVWGRFPELRALVLVLRQAGNAGLNAGALDSTYAEVAAQQAERAESEVPSLQAWRQTYAEMGLKPTQYRCAAEALLRRFRKEGCLPHVLPLIDALNAESMHAAIPIAAFDCVCLRGGVVVRPANGLEAYQAFSGEIERPAVGEIIFADEDHQAHSRRWVFRQGAQSVISPTTDTVLMVAEALHPQAWEDLHVLRDRIGIRMGEMGVAIAEEDMLSPSNRRFEFSL